MTDNSNTQQTTDPQGKKTEVVGSIQNYITSLETENPFQPKALDEFNSKILEFIKDLWEESIRVSKRRKSGDVSVFNVQEANDNLITNRRKLFWSHIGMIGGTLFGIALPYGVELYNNHKLDTIPTIVLILGLSIGGVLMAASWINDS